MVEVSNCVGTLLIQIDLGPISEHYVDTRFATWSSIFMMHVKAWYPHQYQQLGTRFHGYLLFVCHYASGDLVEPVSVWSASECFMLISVLSPSRWLIKVLVGDVYCRVFFWFLSRIKCKTFIRIPRGKHLQASVCSDGRVEVWIEVCHAFSETKDARPSHESFMQEGALVAICTQVMTLSIRVIARTLPQPISQLLLWVWEWDWYQCFRLDNNVYIMHPTSTPSPFQYFQCTQSESLPPPGFCCLLTVQSLFSWKWKVSGRLVNGKKSLLTLSDELTKTNYYLAFTNCCWLRWDICMRCGSDAMADVHWCNMLMPRREQL
jgi:hypothetical protein